MTSAASTAKKILIVDDQKTVRMLERIMLRDAGFQVVEASDGREAVEMAASEQPDLILLDVTMPNMDGYQACQAIRELSSAKRTPVLMVTTRSEFVDMQAGFAAGCTEYLSKPFNARELLDAVRKHLG